MEQPVTLNDYIKKNNEILATIAVLIALTTFVREISIKWIADCLTCISIAAVVTVWFEATMLMPKDGTFRLKIFRYIFITGLYGFIFYWILDYRRFWHVTLFVPVTFLLTYMFMSQLKQFVQFNWVKKLFGIGVTRKWWQKLSVGVLAFVCFIFWSYILAVSVNASYGFNMIFDFLKANMK
jgi:membrane-associated HD superfamily phosphohydrolase